MTTTATAFAALTADERTTTFPCGDTYTWVAPTRITYTGKQGERTFDLPTEADAAVEWVTILMW